MDLFRPKALNKSSVLPWVRFKERDPSMKQLQTSVKDNRKPVSGGKHDHVSHCCLFITSSLKEPIVSTATEG